MLIRFLHIPVKLNANRKITGVLRGFDPFMNITLDNAVEEVSAEERNELGMIVIRGTVGAPEWAQILPNRSLMLIMTIFIDPA